MNLKAETFSLNRLGLLMKRDLLSSYRAMLIRIAAASGILLIIDLMKLWQDGPTLYHHMEIFMAVLFAGGFVFTSAAFKEVHRKETNQPYLLLPASPLEKVGSRILFFTLGWIVTVAVWYTLFSLLSYAVGEILLGSHFPLHSPLHPKLFTAYAHYFVLQSIFLAGAIYFRKTNFFKTVLTLFIALILFAFIMALFVRVFFASHFTGFFVPIESNWEVWQGVMPYHFDGLFRVMKGVGNVFYWGLMAPAAWVLTYFRFREVQVKDGI